MSEKKNTKKDTWKKMHDGAKQEEAAKQSTVTQEKSASTTLHGDTLEPSYQSLKEQLAATQDQLEKCLTESRRYQEQITYHRAEIENIQRRSQIEKENAYKFSLEKLIKELLPVKDCLESALSSLLEENKNHHEIQAVLKGIQLTEQALHKVLEKQGVKVIAPLPGENFDAHYHQAMLTEPHAEYTANTIVKILQKGYLLQERLIRPALVVVAQADNKQTS
jgi:molecular chaperone GrpE